MPHSAFQMHPPCLFFTAAGLRFSDVFCLENEQLSACSLGYSMRQDGCCNYMSMQHRKHFLGWQHRRYPIRTWPRLRRAISTWFFSVTESVPSPFHHAGRQMLLMLALLLQEASVRRQLEITPYFSRVTKSRPWLLLLPAPL